MKTNTKTLFIALLISCIGQQTSAIYDLGLFEQPIILYKQIAVIGEVDTTLGDKNANAGILLDKSISKESTGADEKTTTGGTMVDAPSSQAGESQPNNQMIDETQIDLQQEKAATNAQDNERYDQPK